MLAYYREMLILSKSFSFFMSVLQKYFFEYAFRALLILLPFTTFLSIVFQEKFGIPWFSYLKEIFIASMLIVLCLFHVTWKKRIFWTKYDILIGVYMVVLILVSFFTTGLKGIIYGGRYDFEFLIAFFTLFHGVSFLEKPISYYLRIFLISWWIALFFSFLLKWPFSEDLLLYAGYSGDASHWQFGSSVPIFHGVDGANVRRFQWVFDGPNTMGAYLLLYIGVFAYYLRFKKQWYFVVGWCIGVFVIALLYTYSRSAIIGFILWVLFILFFLFKKLWKTYRSQMIAILLLVCLILGWIFIQYSGNLGTIISRGGSTQWHSERMIEWAKRAIAHPFGQWLWSAGPAYRYTQNLEWIDRQKIEELDRFYIPESWYIQQFIEGGILWGILFLLLMGIILWRLYKVHVLLSGMFISLLTMNFFLHTFESAFLSLSLFLLIGLLLGSHHALRSK